MTSQGLSTNSPNQDTNYPSDSFQSIQPSIPNQEQRSLNNLRSKVFRMIGATLIIIFGLIKLNAVLPEFSNAIPILNDLIINQFIKHTSWSDLEGNIGTIRYLFSNLLTAVFSTLFVIAGFFIILNKPNKRKIVLIAVFFTILQVIINTILGFFSGSL